MAQFLLQNGEGDIAKWDNHYKKGKYSTKRFWQLSFRATIHERKIIVIVESYVEVRYQTDRPPNARKHSNLLFLDASGLKIFSLLKDLC